MKAPESFRARFSKDHLIEIYAERISKSSTIGIDRVKPSTLGERLGDEISLIHSKIIQGKYKFTAYKEKLISKGYNSKPRQISIPTVRDRITLRALCECLGDVYPEAKLKLPHIAIETLKGKLSSGEFSEFAKIDLQGFYPSIPHKLVLGSTWKRIRKIEIRSLIRSAITTPTVPESKTSKGLKPTTIGVPQGLAVSNLLAEISMIEVDKHFNSIEGIWYCRYVDDILILTSNDQAAPTASEIITRLKKMGLKAHEPGGDSKTKIDKLSQEFSFLGYLISSNRIRIRRESILRFESSIAKILTAYKHKASAARSDAERSRALAYCKWKINLRITGCTFNNK